MKIRSITKMQIELDDADGTLIEIDASEGFIEDVSGVYQVISERKHNAAKAAFHAAQRAIGCTKAKRKKS